MEVFKGQTHCYSSFFKYEIKLVVWWQSSDVIASCVCECVGVGAQCASSYECVGECLPYRCLCQCVRACVWERVGVWESVSASVISFVSILYNVTENILSNNEFAWLLVCLWKQTVDQNWQTHHWANFQLAVWKSNCILTPSRLLFVKRTSLVGSPKLRCYLIYKCKTLKY